MKYTITAGGIVYDIGQDALIEDHESDRIADAQQREPQPIPIDEAVEVVKREAKKIEALG